MNDRERNQAIKEAHNIAASEAYFEVRAGVVNPQPHTIFDAGFSRGWDAAMLASATPAPQHENETINKLRAGYPAAIDAAIREQASVVKPVPQYRKEHCADWYDGFPDSEDGGGPYETRTLYTRPAPVREPLTPEQELFLSFLSGASPWDGYWFGDDRPDVPGKFWWRQDLRRLFPAHGITKDTPKPRKASADFDLPAPNDDIGDTQ